MNDVRRGLGFWVAAWTIAVAMQVTLPFLPFGDTPIGNAHLLFWIVVIAAGLCIVASIGVLWRAWVQDTAELGLVGVFFLAVSILPFVHGLTTPGVLVGPNEATMTSVLWATPLACIAAAPILAPRRWAAAILGHWRLWAIGHITLQASIGVGLLIEPNLLPFADMGDPAAVVAALGSLAVCIALSARHLRLFWISRSPGSMAVSIAYGLVASGNLVWINDAPMTPGFWLAHGLDITGVFLGTLVSIRAYRRGQIERYILRPLTERDPLDALELGLDPVVHRFVADMETKDPITHEHVKRTAELSVRVATAMHRTAAEIRLVGLGALLHDVGKLEIDSDVLEKPGRLDPMELDHMRTHAAIGERLVRESQVLAEIAPIVRQHHERIDGTGYPDGIAGDHIHPLARIVAVCDAFDAMIHTRQYREGMGCDKAMAILREHAGSQWDADVVATLQALLIREELPPAPTILADVGREPGCACGDVVPELVATG